MEELLAVKRKRGKKLYYRAKWVGQDEDPEWYPASDFKYSPHKLREFHRAYPDQPGPPRRLDEWTQKWEEGVDDYDELDDDKELGA